MQDSQTAGRASRRPAAGSLSAPPRVGAAAAAVTVLPKVVEATRCRRHARLKPAPEKGGGYSLSEHVKRYYRPLRPEDEAPRCC